MRVTVVSPGFVETPLVTKGLTPLRRRTLEILLESHAALGAYAFGAVVLTPQEGSDAPAAHLPVSLSVLAWSRPGPRRSDMMPA